MSAPTSNSWRLPNSYTPGNKNRDCILFIDENDKQPSPPFPDVEAPPSIADLDRSLAESRRRVGMDDTGHCEGEHFLLKPPRDDVRHASHYYRNKNKAAEWNHVEGVLPPSEKEYNEIILDLRRIGGELSRLVERLCALARF